MVMCLAAAGGVPADEPPPLPEPLTLDAALAIADEAGAPVLLRAQARREQAQAEGWSASARTETRFALGGRLRWMEPQSQLDRAGSDDHRIELRALRPLADFGVSKALSSAAAADLRASEYATLVARDQHRLEVLERYFDILLADLEYTRDNEAMAIAYVRYERTRDAHDLGSVSDAALADGEATYQELRRQRAVSQARRQASRAALAIALDRPASLPSNVEPPAPVWRARELPAQAQPMTDALLKSSPRLAALREELTMREGRLAAARAAHRPVVSAEALAGTGTGVGREQDRWRAGLVVEAPLMQGDAERARVAEALAEWREAGARLQEEERYVRQTALDLWLAFDGLRVEREAVAVLGRSKRLTFDRNQALYEMEAEAHLGDALVGTSEHRLREARVEYRAALLWAHYDALAGRGALWGWRGTQAGEKSTP